MMRSGGYFPLVLPALCLAVLTGLILLQRGSAASDGVQVGTGINGQNDSQLVTPLQAQAFPDSPGPHFDRITTEDGLSQNTVTCILQDSQGFMWFGTTDGL
jgi:hypothetical protein